MDGINVPTFKSLNLPVRKEIQVSRPVQRCSVLLFSAAGSQTCCHFPSSNLSLTSLCNSVSFNDDDDWLRPEGQPHLEQYQVSASVIRTRTYYYLIHCLFHEFINVSWECCNELPWWANLKELAIPCESLISASIGSFFVRQMDGCRVVHG